MFGHRKFRTPLAGLRTVVGSVLLAFAAAMAPAPWLAPRAAADVAIPNFAIELDGLAYFSSLAPYVDASTLFGPWKTYDQPNPQDNNQLVTDLSLLNYPVSRGESETFLRTYPGWREGASGNRPIINYAVSWYGGGGTGLNPYGQAIDNVWFVNRNFANVSSTTLPDGRLFNQATLQFQYNDASGEGSLAVRLDNTMTGTVAPVSGLKIVPVAAGYNPNSIFREDFLRKISPFKVLRMMDWQQTNSGTLENQPFPQPQPFNDTRVVNWADRSTPDMFSRTTIKGVPWEEMIALANASKKDLWINIPDRASDDYVSNLATLLKNTLDPNVKVFVEYSNELWNATPDTDRWQRVLQDGRADPGGLNTVHVNDGVDPTNDLRLIARQMAKRLAQVSGVLKTELGAARVKPVLAGQTPNHGFLQYALDYLARREYGAPPPGDSYQTGDLSHLVASISIAPYVGNDLGAAEPVKRDVDGVVIGSLDHNNPVEREMYLSWLFDNLTKYVVGENGQPGTLQNGVRQHKALSDAYGIKLDSYEGGQHLVASNRFIKDADGTPRPGDYNGELKVLANKDPRMGALYRLLIDTWNAETDNGIFNQFALASPYGSFGSWGLLEDMTQTSSVKWDTFLDIMAGDANLDGLVDFTDFAVLESNFNLHQTRWEDGDFNLDGVVDYNDFLIFRGKFEATPGGATPAESAVLNAFAAAVPEPGTAGLVAAAAWLAACRRRRL